MARIAGPIALLATGDEITEGDITNTNTPFIAQQLRQHHFQPGQHLSVADDQAAMEAAMAYLLSHHHVLITTGGLGPTSDDRTRFALAKVLNQELKFDERSWQQIVKRLSDLMLEIPENNRQQCLFPETATILDNENGTANGCLVDLGEQLIFMLPGPPRECQQLFLQRVLPILQARLEALPIYRQHYLLLGIGEGNLANDIDELIVNFPECHVGYRVSFPYIELKLNSTSESALQNVITKVKPLINDYLISENNQTASEQLQQWLIDHDHQVYFDDQATRGKLLNQLVCAETLNKMANNKETADICIALTGLNEIWQASSEKETTLQMTINVNQVDQSNTLTLRNRGQRTLNAAVEWISHRLLNALTRIKDV